MTDQPPPPGSVPVTAVILAKDERDGIAAAVRSVAWCSQVLVIDSGSTDGTQRIAKEAGAEVWDEPWRGFGSQREYALRHPGVVNDWVLYLDADEWVPVQLAREVADRVGRDGCAAYEVRVRLVFLGRWIRHCGWYERSVFVRLMDRRSAHWPAEMFAERAVVEGPVGVLEHDIVNEERRGLARWLTKHVRYAELEVDQRRQATGPLGTLAELARSRTTRTRSALLRTLAKDVVWPLVPVKPVALFVYMYLLRSGWRDGRVGLVFCLYHAWYHLTVGQLERPRARAGFTPDHRRPPFRDLVPYRAVPPPGRPAGQSPTASAQDDPAAPAARP